MVSYIYSILLHCYTHVGYQIRVLCAKLSVCVGVFLPLSSTVI